MRIPAFRRGGFAWVLAALLVMDLMGVDELVVHPDRGIVQTGQTPSGQARLVSAPPLLHAPSRLRAAAPPEGSDELAAFVGHDRIWPLGSQAGRNTWMTARIRSVGGYHAAKLARYETIRRRLYSEMPAGRLASWLAAAGVVFDRAFSEQQLAVLRQLGADLESTPVRAGEVVVYRNKAALPRARLVDAWAPASSLPQAGDLDAFLAAVQAGDIDPGRTVHLDAAPEPAPLAAGNPLPAPVFTRDGMDDVVLTTAAGTPSVLVLADMNAPGWKVEIDGRPAPLLTADLVLRAVAVPAGAHTIRFHYADPAARTGLMLTIAGFLAAAVLIASPRWRRGGGAATAGPGTGNENG